MITIEFTIADEDISRITEAMVALYPIPMDSDMNPKFTPGQWVKERTRQFIIDTVYRAEQLDAKRQAGNAVVRDDGLAS